MNGGPHVFVFLTSEAVSPDPPLEDVVLEFYKGLKPQCTKRKQHSLSQGHGWKVRVRLVEHGGDCVQCDAV
jgi:hypothetical protein